MYRQMLLEELNKVERGEDPMCVIRNAEDNVMIKLPQEEDKFSEGTLLTNVAKNWNTRYAPNLDEIIAICNGFADNEPAGAGNDRR